jgi:hypothetical protein
VLRNTLEYTVANFKDPKLRADSVGICRPVASAAAAVYPVIFGAQNGTRWTLNRRPQNVGAAISQDVIVEAVSHSLTPDFWQANFSLSQASAAPDGGTYWRMGFGKWTTGTPSATWA